MPTNEQRPLTLTEARASRDAATYARIRRLGVVSWSAIGVIVLAILIAGGLAALSGIVTPLMIAVILGTVLEPVVEWLTRRRMPRGLAATAVLLAAIVVIAGISVVVIRGFWHQLPEITQRLASGWVHMLEWLRSLDLDPVWLERLTAAGSGAVSVVSSGALGVATGAVYAAVTFALGSFFAIYFLFFVLRDGRVFPAWVARVTGRDKALVTAIDENVRQSLRGYFTGTALTAVITGPIFVIPLIVLGIPLIVPTIILYFFLSFVPFIGAWLTGGFAVLIAFGFGGPSAALIVALSLLVSNGPIQNVVLSWALGSSLKIHPVMVLISTIGGGVVEGILGMVLGPPVVSAVQKAVATVRNFRAAPPHHEGTPETEVAT